MQDGQAVSRGGESGIIEFCDFRITQFVKWEFYLTLIRGYHDEVFK